MPDRPYAILTVNVICLLAYGLSFMLVRAGTLNRAAHRQFWNTVLLLAITTAAGLGLFMAVKVNLKLDIPQAGALMKWHVNSGIAMLAIAAFHFSWHTRYYRDLLKRGTKAPADQAKLPVAEESEIAFDPEPAAGKYLFLLPFGLGLVAMPAQVILIREFFFVFYGNELASGILLANWMILTGIGARLGGKTGKPVRIGKLCLVLVSLPLIAIAQVAVLHLSRNLVFITGSMPGMWQLMVFSAVVMAPFCMLSGWLFTASVRSLTLGDSIRPAGTAYSWEAGGSMAGGALFSLVLVFILDPMQALLVFLVISTSFALLFLSKKGKIILITLVCLVTAFIWIFDLYGSTLSRLYPGQEVLLQKQTPYGNLVVTRSGSQLNFYDDNLLASSSGNPVPAEESVHYALLQRSAVDTVLVAGGGLSGALAEVLKYPVKQADFLEMNAAICKTGLSYKVIPADVRIRFHAADPRVFIRKTPNSYDAVLMLMPEPSTLRSNRYYTEEFWKDVKAKLRPGGIISFGIMPTVNYAGKESVRVHAVLCNTLKKHFRNVVIIPGDKDYFIASDSALQVRVAGLPEKRNIPTAYVNSYYLDDEQIAQRSREIMSELDPEAGINADFSPVAAFGQLNYWLSQFGSGFLNILLSLVVIFILALILVRGRTFTGLAMAGFTSASAEMILLLVFQVMFGYLYLSIGLFFTLFMGGLALGSYLSGRLVFPVSQKVFLKGQGAITGLAGATCLMIFFLDKREVPPVISVLLIGLCLVCFALATGWQYALGTSLRAGNVPAAAGSLYFADLAGSSAGALITVIWLVPVLGIMKAIAGITALNLLVVLVLPAKKKN